MTWKMGLGSAFLAITLTACTSTESRPSTILEGTCAWRGEDHGCDVACDVPAGQRIGLDVTWTSPCTWPEVPPYDVNDCRCDDGVVRCRCLDASCSSDGFDVPRSSCNPAEGPDAGPDASTDGGNDAGDPTLDAAVSYTEATCVWSGYGQPCVVACEAPAGQRIGLSLSWTSPCDPWDQVEDRLDLSDCRCVDGSVTCRCLGSPCTSEFDFPRNWCETFPTDAGS